MKKWRMILYIIALCICYVGQGVQTVALENVDAYQQDVDSYELSQDSFYRTHKKDCKRGRGSYIAKKEVTCYKNPESDMKVAPIEKGSTFNVAYTYQTNFDTWGLEAYSSNQWVKLRDLEFVENADSFIAEYWKEMGKPKNADLKKALGTVADTLQKDIVKWSYPCSGKIVGTCSPKKYPTMDDILRGASLIYQDKQKRYWRIYGDDYDRKTGEYKSYAICLSDPENNQIGKEITLTEPYTGGKYGRWLTVIPVGIVICLLMAGLIVFVVRRRLRMKKMEEDA